MTDPESSSEPEVTIVQAEVKIRRAPKVSVFIILGALVGAIVTVIVTSAFPADPSVGYLATVGYFLLYGVPFGIVVGAVVAIVLDRVSSRRARSITVERTVVDALPYDDEPYEDEQREDEQREPSDPAI
ncbi:MAG: hypothetical protein JWQ16_3534 [Novosphingobium sp.]|jgi:gas vesicle protein|nr:hypothetical protein [Novosphingobium sp.]